MILEKYLYNSYEGEISVTYFQNNGKGNYYASGSLSLQNIPRAIRFFTS